jgi:acetyltransferase family protein
LKHQVFVLDTHWRDGLEEILFGDPIPNLYPIEHYAAVPLPKSAPPIPLQHYQGFVGCARGDTLCCVVLLGSNVVPVRLCCAYEEVPGGGDCAEEGSIGALHRDALAQLLLQVGVRTDSIFGESDYVMPLWERMQQMAEETERPSSSVPLLHLIQPSLSDVYDPRTRVLSERPVQPLLYLPPEEDLSALYEAPLPSLPENLPPPQDPLELDRPVESVGYARLATVEDEERLLVAAAAMFTEEVGFDPIARYGDGYRARLHGLIRAKRCAIVTDASGRVIFKADAGIASLDTAQVQGVWMHPDYRGLGLAKPFFAAASRVLQRRYRHLSLYVNDYNAAAVALYSGTGWVPIGRFSTIIFEN